MASVLNDTWEWLYRAEKLGRRLSSSLIRTRSSVCYSWADITMGSHELPLYRPGRR